MLLARQVAGRNYPPTNKNILIRALTEEWDKLPQQLLDNVVQKGPVHAASVVAQGPPLNAVWKCGERGASSSVVLVT
ncbi:hypothetical protein TNCV_782821 [Trichonephila clavipes]|nr:hypothetical protein TNCV_782821 [Trichonephila clavipes]